MLQSKTPQFLVEKATKALLKAGFDSPRREAEALLCGSLNFSRSQIYSQGSSRLLPYQLARFKKWLNRRLNREPLAYISGKREFWSLDFHVNQEVLIPRPETECLIEACLEYIPKYRAQKILEIGTGSGVISTVLSLERPQTSITATDLSKEALSVAKKNLNEHLVGSNISLLLGDLFEPVSEGEIFDLIVSNPPYIPESMVPDLEPDVFRFEPSLALVGGKDGLDLIRKICQEAPLYMSQEGILCFEFGFEQQEPVREILKTNRFNQACFGKDYAGHPRFVLSTKNALKTDQGAQGRLPMEPL